MTKIISWNVNGIRACCKKGFYDFFAKELPDVICLQEIKASRDQVPEEFNSKMYRYSAQEWYPAKRPGYSGVASLFLAVEPVSIKRGMAIEKFDEEGRVLVSDHKDFFLLNCYFPNGGSGEIRDRFKMEFLAEFIPFIKRLDQKKPVILTGDVNIAHRSIDVYDPIRLDGTSGFKPEEREWMDELMRAGFADAYRHFYPEAREQYTWWSYRTFARERNRGWRLDYFIVSERLLKKIKSVTLHQDVLGSDHCPVSVIF